MRLRCEAPNTPPTEEGEIPLGFPLPSKVGWDPGEAAREPHKW